VYVFYYYIGLYCKSRHYFCLIFAFSPFTRYSFRILHFSLALQATENRIKIRTTHLGEIAEKPDVITTSAFYPARVKSGVRGSQRVKIGVVLRGKRAGRWVKRGKARNGERPVWRTRLGPHGRTFWGRNGEC